jgi:hypothetical protein
VITSVNKSEIKGFTAQSLLAYFGSYPTRSQFQQIHVEAKNARVFTKAKAESERLSGSTMKRGKVTPAGKCCLTTLALLILFSLVFYIFPSENDNETIFQFTALNIDGLPTHLKTYKGIELCSWLSDW